MKINDYLKQITTQKNKGMGYELLALKTLTSTGKSQRSGVKSYNITRGYTGLKFYVGGEQFYEQDVMLRLDHDQSRMATPFYKIGRRISTKHSTKNIAIQCKNYSGKVSREKVNHDLVQIGMGGIIGYNLPIKTIILNEHDNSLTEHEYKKEYHIQDMIKPHRFNTEYLDKDVKKVKNKTKYVALKNLGKIRISYNTIKDQENTTLEDIVEYANNKKTRKVKFEKHDYELGTLMLVLKRGRPRLVNVIKYSQQKDEGITMIKKEEDLAKMVRKTWQFLNPEIVIYLAENKVTSGAMKQIMRVKANNYTLQELVSMVEKGDLLKKMDKFSVDYDRCLGRKMSGDAEDGLDNLTDYLIDTGKHKHLNKKEWYKVLEGFLYEKQRWH